MAGEDETLPNNPRDAFEKYILELERDYYPFYDRASKNAKLLLVVLPLTAIIASAAPHESPRWSNILKR